MSVYCLKSEEKFYKFKAPTAVAPKTNMFSFRLVCCSKNKQHACYTHLSFEMFIIFNDIQRKKPMVSSVEGYCLQMEPHTMYVNDMALSVNSI